MTAPALSPRLRAVAEHVIPGEPFADIGTDHALLPIHLVRTGYVPRAIATDRAAGPLAAAERTLAEHPCAVELRRGDGLTVLRPDEVATVVLAGMGGRRIKALVDATPDLPGLRRVVLSPNTSWDEVREWLATKPWPLVAENLVGDRGKQYLVIVVDMPCARAFGR